MKSAHLKQLFRGSRIYFWILANVVTAFDQITKIVFVPSSEAARSAASHFVIIPGLLRIFPAHLNPKGAFSMGPEGVTFYIVASVIGLAIIGWFMMSTPPQQTSVHIALGCLFAGALGNLIDRLTLGAVRDFIDLHWGQYHWPTFNVADMAICGGVAVLLWTTFTAEIEDPPQESS